VLPEAPCGQEQDWFVFVLVSLVFGVICYLVSSLHGAWLVLFLVVTCQLQATATWVFALEQAEFEGECSDMKRATHFNVINFDVTAFHLRCSCDPSSDLSSVLWTLLWMLAAVLLTLLCSLGRQLRQKAAAVGDESEILTTREAGPNLSQSLAVWALLCYQRASSLAFDGLGNSDPAVIGIAVLALVFYSGGLSFLLSREPVGDEDRNASTADAAPQQQDHSPIDLGNVAQSRAKHTGDGRRAILDFTFADGRSARYLLLGVLVLQCATAAATTLTSSIVYLLHLGALTFFVAGINWAFWRPLRPPRSNILLALLSAAVLLLLTLLGGLHLSADESTWKVTAIMLACLLILAYLLHQYAGRGRQVADFNTVCPGEPRAAVDAMPLHFSLPPVEFVETEFDEEKYAGCPEMPLQRAVNENPDSQSALALAPASSLTAVVPSGASLTPSRSNPPRVFPTSRSEPRTHLQPVQQQPQQQRRRQQENSGSASLATLAALTKAVSAAAAATAAAATAASAVLALVPIRRRGQ